MRLLQEERRLRRILGSRPIFFVLLLGIVFFGWKALMVFWEVRKTNRELSFIEQEMQDLEKKGALLKEQIKNLVEEEDIEQEARRLLNLKRKGEEAIIIVDEPELDRGWEARSGDKTRSGVLYWIKQLLGL